MKITKTKIEGAFVLEPTIKKDERGYFYKVFSRHGIGLDEVGIDFQPNDINQSGTNKKGTIRGLHYQEKPYEEEKLMQCIQGVIYNVIVDMRENSATYLEWLGVELSARNHRMLLVPKGCANGFQAIRPNSIVQYISSAPYVPGEERGVRWDDPKIGIDWPIKEVIVSDKDKNLTSILSML